MKIERMGYRFEIRVLRKLLEDNEYIHLQVVECKVESNGIRDIVKAHISKRKGKDVLVFHRRLDMIGSEKQIGGIWLTKEQTKELKDEIRKIQNEILKEKNQKICEEYGINSWEIKEKSTYDEGGRTKMYIHTFQFPTESLQFTERNIFDFGRTINPAYPVAPGLESGGLMTNIDEEPWWQDFDDDKGWYPVRKLTEHECTCMKVISIYGGFSDSGIRM